jgi:hypothetical protein
MDRMIKSCRPRFCLIFFRLRKAAMALTASTVAASAFADGPLLEVGFNNTDNLSLQNGAQLGPEGSKNESNQEANCSDK